MGVGSIPGPAFGQGTTQTEGTHGVSADDDEVEQELPDEPPGRGSERERTEATFREFVTARWPALLRTAYLLTGEHDRAEELVQGALVRVHRHWSKVERAGSPDAYVRKVIVNLNTDWWRRLGSRERPVGLVADVDRPGTTDPYASFELREDLWLALRELPARMRATLVLRYFEDLTEADTAQVLGCSLGTVKSQTSRGLDRLGVVLARAQRDDAPGEGRAGAAATAPADPPKTNPPVQGQVRSAR
jgi:RNA polymerase sigma-70 factor (sigma-E family)